MTAEALTRQFEQISGFSLKGGRSETEPQCRIHPGSKRRIFRNRWQCNECIKRYHMTRYMQRRGSREKLYYFDVLLECHHSLVLPEPEPATGDPLFCFKCDNIVNVYSAFVLDQYSEEYRRYNSPLRKA